MDIKKKKKLLFLMRDFVQAGAQRYQFELIKALDKDKYEIDVLALLPLGSNEESGFVKEYYFPLIQKLVKNIIFLPQILKKERQILRGSQNRFTEVFRKSKGINTLFSAIEQPIKTRINKKITALLDQYDFINCTEYDYTLIKDAQIDVNKLLIHVMTGKMQTFPQCQFKDFNYNQTYNFAALWRVESDNFEFSNFQKQQNILRLRLLFDTSSFTLIPYPHSSQKFKIGLFTRIDYRLKPLDPFFYALHLLRNRGLDVTLHIYGAGDSSGFQRTINTLSLQEAVIFEGHQEDLRLCLETAKLNTAWFQAMNYEPAGYAAYEIMARGVPNIFWDFQPLSKNAPQGTVPYPMFWDIEKMVDYTQNVLNNGEIAKTLGIAQRNHLIEHVDVKRFLPVLNQFFK
jgi:glycosyltransferase involved in cell wall biosynthesis